MYLLDTCTILWLAVEPSRLSARCRELMMSAHDKLYVSSISAFEIGQKVARGGIELPLPTSAWFPQILEHHGLQEIPISPGLAAEASELPKIHNDPFDRLIIATAISSGLRILTPDKLVAQYPDIQVLW